MMTTNLCLVRLPCGHSLKSPRGLPTWHHDSFISIVVLLHLPRRHVNTETPDHFIPCKPLSAQHPEASNKLLPMLGRFENGFPFKLGNRDVWMSEVDLPPDRGRVPRSSAQETD